VQDSDIPDDFDENSAAVPGDAIVAGEAAKTEDVPEEAPKHGNDNTLAPAKEPSKKKQF